jgi:hypothetical protein
MMGKTDRTRAVLAVASIFVVGAVAGVVVDRLALIPVQAHAAAVMGGHAGPREHDAVLADLMAHLELTAPQGDSVRAILATHQQEIDRIWMAVHQNLQETVATVTTEVERVLEPDQVQRLHAWIEERHGPIPGHAGGRAH